MLSQVIQDLTRKQRPYYLLQDTEIKGVNNNYWLIFKHRDADNLLKNIVSFLSFTKHSTYKIFRIDLNNAHIFEYTPKREGNIPTITLFRTSNLTVIEQFLTFSQDGFGRAISTGFKTPELTEIISSERIINQGKNLYQELVKMKEEYQRELNEPETLDQIKLNSERLSRIQNRISNMSKFPTEINRKTVTNTLKKLKNAKDLRAVQKLLKNYTDGNKSKLNDEKFIINLVKDTDNLSLLTFNNAQPASLKFSLCAMLLRV